MMRWRPPLFKGAGGSWQLFFQRFTYYMTDGRGELPGLRFMWRKDGKLQTTRGRARIHDAKQLVDLLQEATEHGWFKDDRLRFTGF
jgi:hypothetical protein